MREKGARQAELYRLWEREMEGWIAPLVRRREWTADERADLLAELKHHTVRGLLKSWEEIENLRAFCVTIAINYIRDRAKELRTRPEPTPTAAIEKRALAEAQSADEEALGEAAEAREEIYEVIRRLRYELVPAEWDVPFSLVFEFRMGVREAARTLGQPYSSLEYRIVRAVEKIKEKLQELVQNDPELEEMMVTAFGRERTADLLGEEAGS